MEIWQKKLGEFLEEMSPVARAMMDTGIQELGGLERQGYFRFGSDLLEALRRVVETYEPGSLPELADSFADMVYLLRLFSQPKMLAAAQDLAEGIQHTDSKPIEVLGAARRIETEKDIQRGIGFALDLLGTLGRSVSRAPRLKTRRKVARAPRPQATMAAAVAFEKPAPISDAGWIPDQEWNPEWVEKLAQSLGFASMTQEMWTIIEFSRKEYRDTKKSPNLRRITKALNISTKDVYALFPEAPGPTISKLAGVPKPAGCL